MIMSKTPMRVSFFGGGTDLPSYYLKQEGCVVTTAINKYIYINVKKKFDKSIRLSYSTTETVKDVSEIKHDIVRESLSFLCLKDSIEITSISDLPSNGTGMGSSSAYCVGLLNSLYAHSGVMMSCDKLAKYACRIEMERLKKPIGKQDQYIAAYGGFNFISFRPNGEVVVEPICCSEETVRKLEQNIILFYTGFSRGSDSILDVQNSNMSNIRSMLDTMVSLTKEIKQRLSANDISYFGSMLHESWIIKRKLVPGITNSVVDHYYQVGRKCGAEGGKLLGAGGGGFIMFYADPDAQNKIKNDLRELIPLSIKFEANGSQIVYKD
jgi:D-glycero-alpha-D-manno-heptose-7-phosphate kinase